MNTKSIPAIVMLLAGFIACIAGMHAHMEVAGFLKMLLIVLIIFYILGCVIKLILDRNFVEVQEEETTDGDQIQSDEDVSEETEEENASDNEEQ